MNDLSRAVTRQKIEELQESMMEIRCDAPEPRHFFSPGVYLREFSMPKGMLCVGRRHKHDHLMVIRSGSAEIVSEFGRDIVKGGDIFESKAGVKRVVYALEDVTFITIHHNPENLTDIDTIESMITEEEGFKPEFRKSVSIEDLSK